MTQDKIRQCPNPLCKLSMRLLTVDKKPSEYYCTACETSQDKRGNHFKRHVERYMEQGFVDEDADTGYMVTKEGNDEGDN